MEKNLEFLRNSIKEIEKNKLAEIYEIAIDIIERKKYKNISSEDILKFNKSLLIGKSLFEFGFNNEIIAASVLYSLYCSINSNTLGVINPILKQIDKKIYNLLLDTIKISRLINKLNIQSNSINSNQINVLRKILLCVINDPRSLIIKLAESFSLMKSLNTFKKDKRIEISKMALNIYAPIANYLGINKIKCILEDLAFEELENSEFNEIKSQITSQKLDCEKRMEEIIDIIKQKLNEIKIKFVVYGRVKHIYSIRKKILLKSKVFSNIYDIIAARIIVDNIAQCYEVLNIIHNTWNPIIEEFNDYIARPKDNGYQSIHTALIDSYGKFFEIQIRTHKMHELAESGVASHWLYKEANSSKNKNKVNIDELINLQKFLTNSISQNIDISGYNEKTIYAFTPCGDIIDLPKGSTPIDFAYRIHTNIGHSCSGAKINGKLMQLNYIIKNNDVIEIVKGKKNIPNKDWLISKHGYIKNASTRYKILKWFRDENFRKNYDIGRVILEHELKKNNIKNIKSIEDELMKIVKKHNFNILNELIAAIGSNNISIEMIINDLKKSKEQNKKLNDNIYQDSLINKGIHVDQKNAYQSNSIEHFLYNISKCCNASPGDKIIGYITRGRGVHIHKISCKNIHIAENLFPERLIPIEWSKKIKEYIGTLLITCINIKKIIDEINIILLKNNIKIVSTNIKINKSENFASLKLRICIPYEINLKDIINEIGALKNIYEVKKLNINNG